MNDKYKYEDAILTIEHDCQACFETKEYYLKPGDLPPSVCEGCHERFEKGWDKDE